MKGTHLGEFEELTLLLVLILEEDAYVLKIKEELYQQANRSMTLGSLHSTLSRLESKGYLESEMKGASKARGGRRKRVYMLTAAGKGAVNTARELRQKLWSQVPQFSLKTSHA